MSLQRPAATFELRGGGPLSLAEAAVRRVRVDLSVDEAHDRVELWLWRDSVLASEEPGASLSVGLGDDGAVEDVLTAEVAWVDLEPWGAVLTAFAPSRKLSATYLGRAYVDQTVADIVADLLSEAGVDAGEVDAPLQLPAFHVEPRRSAWGVLHALARRTGHQLTSTSDGALSYTPVPGAGGGPLGGLSAAAGALGLAPSATLREGAELVDFRAGGRPEAPAPAVVTPSAGTGPRWHLLAAEPDSGSSAPVLVDPALRTREAADAATSAYAAAARRAARAATATVPGRPELRAGATVTARDAAYRILRVRHLLDADAGFLSDLLLEGDQ
jgi:hypothetical protein